MAIELIQLDSQDSFRQAAEAWDDLWLRSEIDLPTQRASVVLACLEQFASAKPMTAIVVAENGRFLAALPLVEGVLGHALKVGILPNDCWSSAGDLLLDPECDQSLVLAKLIEGISRLPWPLLSFDTIELEQPRWKAFQKALQSADVKFQAKPQFRMGLIDIDSDWDSYRARWSRNHRKDINRRLRKAELQGELKLTFHRSTREDELRELVHQGFEIEDRGWKGSERSSVLAADKIEFFQSLAREMLQMGYLELVSLQLNDQPIAFEFGYAAKGVHFAHKSCFDESHADLSPGQLLMMMQLKHYFEIESHRMFDTMGMLTPAWAKWCTRDRTLGKLFVSTSSWQGNAMLRGYNALWPLVRASKRVIGLVENEEPIPLGAMQE